MIDYELEKELRGTMLDEKDPVLRGMMAKAGSLGAKPQFIVMDVEGHGKVAYPVVIVSALYDQVYNTLVPVVTKYVSEAILGELERRGVIPPAPPFVDPSSEQQGKTETPA